MGHILIARYETLILLHLVHFTTLEQIQPCIMNQDAMSHVYPWNKSHLSPLDYQHGFCSMRCHGETRVEFSDSCWTLECVPCFCKRPACEIYNVCCPDITEPFRRPILSSKISLPTNISVRTKRRLVDYGTPVLGCDLVDGQRKAYLYIRSCSSNYRENKTMVDLCERDRKKQEETIETFVRVVDLSTHVVYKNKFCAMCNNVQHFARLPMKLVSDNFLAFYKASNVDDILQRKLIEGANVIIEIPENISNFNCIFASKKSRHSVDSCGLSIEKDDVDEDIMNACENLTGYRYRVYDTVEEIFYKNIFCAICHMGSWPKCYHDCVCHDGIFSILPLPFSLLLDLKPASRYKGAIESSVSLYNYSHCSLHEWSSPDGHCVPLFCSAGKRLDNNQCTDILEELRGLRYRLCSWIVPLYSDRQDMHESELSAVDYEIIMDNIVTQIKIMLRELTQDFQFRIYANQSPNVAKIKSSHMFWLESSIMAIQTLTRSQFERAFLETFTNANISVQNSNNQSLEHQMYIISPLAGDACLPKQNQLRQTQINILNKTYTKKHFADFTEISILMSSILLCQYVKFGVTKYEMNIDYNFLPPNIRITIDLNVTKINITDLKDFSMVEIDEDGGLNVCQDLLDSKLKADKDNIQQDLLNRKLEGTSLAEYIVSIICCVASIVCLLLTLLTYFMFPLLRTEAGINNMFLSFSLLLAQISLLIASHIFRSSVMCTVIGITTHFLWLWMFSWSFICSYHMFRVFTDNTRKTRSHKEMNGLWKKILFSFVSSLFVVCVTITYSVFTSDGQEIGYGEFSCYLNSPLLVGVTLAGPLSITTLINVVFFLITVYKIYKVSKLQSIITGCDQQRNHWYVYARLSTVTGAFWAVAIIASVFESKFLRFISIILNGLQGVSIFMSFICNKRVLHLYSQLGKHKRVKKQIIYKIS